MTDATSGGSYSPRRFKRPYDSAAPAYRKKGWIPLPIGLVEIQKDQWRWLPGRKSSPPGGFTGGEGRPVDDEQTNEWRGHLFKGAANLGLRLDGAIGLDIDGPEGLHILSFYEKRIGPLPATWTSTSRGAGSDRRILVFRIPPDLNVHGAEWALRERHGERGEDSTLRLPLDIIHQRYRYMVAYPSIHPSGEQYVWYDPTGEVCGVPELAALPELPGAWQQLMVELVQEHIACRRRGDYVRTGERGYTDNADRGWTAPAAEACIKTALDHIRTWPQGDGAHYNSQLYKRAHFLFMFAPAFLDEDDVQTVIEAAVTDRFGEPDRDDLRTIASARRSVHETFALIRDPFDLLDFDDED